MPAPESGAQSGAAPAGEPGRGFARRTFSSFRSRNFRLFFGGQTISQVGNWLTMVALTLLVLHRTGSGVAIGLLSACQFGPTLLLSAWAGVIVDRYDKRTLMAITQGLEMAQSCALAALAFMTGAPLIAFYGVAVVGGCLFALESPVRRSLVNELVPIEDLPNAITLYSAMNNLARVAGPALAGVLILVVGYGWCFAIDALSYIVVLTALLMMRADELRRVPVTRRGSGQIRAGLRYVAAVPDLWITFVMLLAVGTLSYNFVVVFPLFVEKSLGGGDGAYTLVFSAFSFGGFVGALFLARRSHVTIRTVAGGSAALGTASVVLAVMPGVALAVVVALVVGAASVAYMTSTTAIAQLRSDRTMMGRVLSIQTVLLVGTTPFGGLLMGAVADSVDARAPLLIGGAAALAAAAFGVLAARRTERHPARVEPATT